MRPPPSPPQDTPPQPAPREEPPVEEPALGQEDDSLMDCGEDDEEFDPLKRTSSFTRSSSFARSGSLSGQRGALVPVATQPQSQPSGDVMNQLAGISLSSGGGPVPVLPPDSVQQQQPVLQSQLSMSELLNPMHSVPNGGSPAASTTTSQLVQGGVAMVAMPMTTGAGAGVQPVAYPHPTPYMVPGGMVVNQQVSSLNGLLFVCKRVLHRLGSLSLGSSPSSPDQGGLSTLPR